ncbi:MAG: hypothetical protein K6L74_10195 [Neptuniibacter sp.]
MNVKKMLAATTVCLFSIPALADPISPSELLATPENFSFSSCKFAPGEENNFILDWSTIPEAEGKKPATKYASEVNCVLQRPNPEDEENPIIYGDVEAEVTVKARDCEEGTCSTTIPYSDIDAALIAAIESGEIVLDEDTELGDYQLTCDAKVKGLNPPNKRQNHPQAVAQCTVGSCPAWSAGELASIGSYSTNHNFLRDDQEIDSVFYPNAIFDQENGYSPNINTWVLAGYTDEGEYYGAYHFDVDGEENDIWVRRIPLTFEEYEACKQEILDHCVIDCGT